MKIKLWVLRFLFICLLAGSQYIQGQNTGILQPDSIKSRRTYIELSDIPIRSAEIKNKTREDIHDMIPDGTIRRLKAKNDLVIASIDFNLLTVVDMDDSSKNIRYLESRKISLMQEQRKINDLKAELSIVLDKLDGFKNKLNEDLLLWQNTEKRLEKDSLSKAMPVKLTETISFLDSTLMLVVQKSNSVLDIIDKTIATGVEIDSQIERIKALILTKQSQAFESDHLTLFELNYRTSYGKEIADSFRHLRTVNLVDFKRYINKNRNSVYLIIVIFLGLFYMFHKIKRSVTINETGYGYFYKQMLMKVILHPISATIFLTLFSTMLIFPDRSTFFREISLYVIAFPLVHILSILLHKRYHFYLYAFGIMIVFYLLLVFFLNETVIYRILLLFIATAEIALFSLFLLRLKKNDALSISQNRLVFIFIMIHLVLATVGFFANITGRVILTEIVLGAVFSNIFNGLTILITFLLIDGLIATNIDTKSGQSLNVFRIYGEEIKRKAIYVLNFLAIFLWIILLLRNFRIIDYVFKGIGSIFTHKISIGSASFSLDLIFIFFIVIYVSVILSKIIQIFLEEDVLNRFSLSKGLPHTIAMMVKYSLVTGGFFLAVNAAGIPVNQLTIILGAFSVGIGFGLQNIFNNLVSGLILLFERPIQLGDTVQVGQLTGNVKSIGIRASNIRTFDGAEVIVPNGQLISNEVINWTLSDQNRRVEILVGVSYNSDPKQVHSLLIGILKQHPEVLQKPSPLVYFKGLGESSLDFTVFAWIADYNEGLRIKSELLFRIFEVFKENKIEIPFPQRDLHLKSVDKSINLHNTYNGNTDIKDGESFEK